MSVSGLASAPSAAIDVALCAWKNRVRLTEYHFRRTDLPNGQVSSAWVIGGLALARGDTGLRIHNARDENGLGIGPP